MQAVRQAAWKVVDTERQLAELERSTDGDHANRDVAHWRAESRKERMVLVRASKAALDAGVAARLIRQTELETQILMRVLGRTLDSLDLTQDQRITALSVVQQELLALDSPDSLRELPDDGR